MRKLLRAVPALLAVGLSATFVMCTAKSPSNPLANTGPSSGGNTQTTNLPSIVVTALRFDLNADGSDSTTVIARAKDASGKALVGAQVLWSVNALNFSGGTGTLGKAISLTDSEGQAIVQYTAPAAAFVPVGAIEIVSGTVSIPNNPQGSPRAAVSLLLRPKGSASGGTTGAAGTPIAPTVTAVAPSTIKVDATPAVVAIVQGTDFTNTSQVLVLTSDELVAVTPEFFSSTQLRFSLPATTKIGATGVATLFVTGPFNTLSSGFGIKLTSGVVVDQTLRLVPLISNILPAQGPTTQATTVVLLGSGFNITSDCPVGGTPTSTANVTIINEFLGLSRVCPIEPPTLGRLVITLPSVASNQSGPVNIFVTNSDGSISNPVIFTYTTSQSNSPAASTLSPNIGPTTGETSVSISGANFSSTDEVVIAGPNIFNNAGGSCSSGSSVDGCCDNGSPVCSDSGQCTLSAARGKCRINGTLYSAPFVFHGSGQIDITTPNVGSNAAGPVTFFVRTAGGVPSNGITFTYTNPANLLPPTISAIDVAHYGSDGCCPAGWKLLILGSNFRKCSSVIVRHFGQIHEILPTPDISDCKLQRGANSTISPHDRMLQLLPPDGMKINCNRPDLVPLHFISGTTYRHDSICYGTSLVASAFCPYDAAMIPKGADPNDITSGGAVTFISDSEIRILYGPDESIPCESTDDATIYVSNDPGRGISGEQISNAKLLTFTNSLACPTPTPLPASPSISSLSISKSSCNGGATININGTNLNVGGNPAVDFGLNPASLISVSATKLTVTVPAAVVGGSDTCNGTYSCNAPPCPPAFFECGTQLTVTTTGGAASITYTYTSSAPNTCL